MARLNYINTGLTEPIVHSQRGASAKLFDYRVGTGLGPSAEHNVFFDDFHQFVVATAITNGPVANTPWSWQGAIIDSGATSVIDTTAAIGATGVLKMSDATASEGVAVYGTKSIQLTSGKKFFMEMRVRTDDVTDNIIQFGLSDLTATTNPEDLWTTTAANLVALGIQDGAGTLTMLADKSNSGTTLQTSSLTTGYSMVADTWHVLAIGYNGAKLRGYIDGKEVLLWSSADSTIPTGVALAPFFGVLNGNGAGGNNNYVDYVRWAIER